MKQYDYSRYDPVFVIPFPKKTKPPTMREITHALDAVIKNPHDCLNVELVSWRDAKHVGYRIPASLIEEAKKSLNGVLTTDRTRLNCRVSGLILRVRREQ